MRERQIKNKNTIKELFYMYTEEIYANVDIDRVMGNKILKQEHLLYDQLTKKQKKIYQKLDALKAEYEIEKDKDIFVYAFCLAIKLILESQN